MTWKTAAAVLIGTTIWPVALTAGQDPLLRAKDYYASASYEEALQVISQLRSSTPGSVATEVVAYQVFCLVALGRHDEAAEAIEAIVTRDPLYRPAESEVSPRVRAFFDEVRQPLLPDLVQRLYAAAKDDLEREEVEQAAAGFDQVVSLLDDIPADDDQTVSDLRTLAEGFRDLSRALADKAAAAAVEPEAEPEPIEDPVIVRASPPVGAGVFGPNDSDVTPPVVVARDLPAWRPVSAVDKLQSQTGGVELLVNEEGFVVSATVFDGVNPNYDEALLRAAKSWRFHPAMRNGTAVKYRYVMEIHLSAGER